MSTPSLLSSTKKQKRFKYQLIYRDDLYCLVKADRRNYALFKTKGYQKHLDNPDTKALGLIGYYSTLSNALQRLIGLETDDKLVSMASLQGVFTDIGVMIRCYHDILNVTTKSIESMLSQKTVAEKLL